MSVFGRKWLVLLITLVVPLFCFQENASADCFATAWPQEKSDLQPDPAMIFGQLDNGFRYVLMHNTEPQNRVAMKLDIQAGSLNESEQQRGIAHFLEHMLFNGSTNFKPGELVEYFQSIGMSFGGDTNAHTSYDETVYDITLPKGDIDTIEKGLLVFSDYARGATLLQTEIDRERGVILAEKRSRDSAAYRAHVAETKFSMAGTLIPERMPIGTVATINSADHALMKQFYDDWYRPKNMVLVMVGDFDPQKVEPLLVKQFSSLKGEGAQPSCPDLGSLKADGTDFFYHYEAEMGRTETSIGSLWNETPVDDSFALEQKELLAYTANQIMQYRLDDLASKSSAPFTKASIYSGVYLDRIGYAEIGAKSDPGKWKESLLLMENSLRRALDSGFTEVELQRVKKELLAQLDSAVLTASTRNSRTLASAIVRNINSNRVGQSPQQELELFGPVLIKMTLQEVEDRFREVWSHPRRIVKVNGNVILGDAPRKTIQASYEKALASRPDKYKGEIAKSFPYLQFGTSQPPIAKDDFPAIGVTRYVFANGLILNLKKTSFEENSLEISVDFGLGKASEASPGLAMLTKSVVGLSGTARIPKNGLDRILAGSSVDLGFQVNPASFSWQGKGLTKDAELLFQVLQSLLADPAVDKDAFVVSMERFKQFYKALASDVAGGMPLEGDAFLAEGHPGFGLPSWQEFSALSKEQVEAWFLPALSSSPLELSIVGDFDEEKILDLVGKYFSVLPKKEKIRMKKQRAFFPEGKSLALTVPSTIDKAMLVVAWKSDDFWDIQRTRGLHLLAEIFSDKMRRVIREKMGASYSPQVYNSSSRIYDGYGVIRAVLVVNPSEIKTLKDEVLKIANELWQGNISDEELERAKGPMLTSLNDMVRSNRYWLGSVLSLSSRYPQQLQWPQSILQSFAGFQTEDIRKLAHDYLEPRKAAVITVVPAINQ